MNETEIKDLKKITKILNEKIQLDVNNMVNNMNWAYYSSCANLSEDFIWEHQDKVNWSYISQFQTLSENFIREIQDKVDWYYIGKCQHLSISFIEEFKNKLK